MAAIDRKKNRLDLYNLIKSDLLKKGKQVSFKDFIDNWFYNSLTFALNRPKTYDGKIYYTNLFDYLTKTKLQNGKTFLETYGSPGNILGNGSVSNLKSFFNAFACREFEWTKNIKYCKVSDDSTDNQTVTDLKQYVGLFNITDNNLISIMSIIMDNTGTSLLVNIPDLDKNTLFNKYVNLELKNVGGLKFQVYNSGELLPNSEFVFKNSDEFNFKISEILTGVGKRTKNPILPDVDKKDEIKPQDDTKTDDTKKDNQKSNTTYVFVPPVDDNQKGTPKDSFPFKLKDQNAIIGDINEKLFGKGHRRNDVFTSETLNALISYHYIKPTDKNPEITQGMYDQILIDFTRKSIKESVKKVLKEYINKKKVTYL